MKGRMHRWGWPVLVAALLAASGAGASCRKGDAAVAEQAEPPASAEPAQAQRQVLIDPDLVAEGRVVVKPAERRALADETLASGEVVPSPDGVAEVGALVSGRVASILVNDGDKVKAGQVLATIDAPEAARMQGDLVQARARLWRAEKMVEQERKLWADKATSERSLQAAEAELREAQAAVRSARNLLSASRVPAPAESASGGSARIAIASPIAGVISRRSAVLGGHVTAETSLFEVVAIDKLMLRANVSEVLARRVEPGSPAVIRQRGAEQTCNGTVQSRLNRIDEQRRTMGVMVSVAPGCQGLVPGAFADVTVRLSASGAESAIVVPRTAIVEFDGAPSVFVEAPTRGPGHFDIRIVRVGLTDGVHSVIEDGLKEGEPVAVVGALLLKGEHIRKDLE
jgi:cobalt-zinc-cadmium efflux system membrane fusion protein